MELARYWEKVKGKQAHCQLCPQGCVIPPGGLGMCLTRENHGGTLYAINYGIVVSASLDPVEKKPLYHFYPGRQILSLGTFGCNFKCPYCQNWQFSQHAQPGRQTTPEQAVKLAKKKRSFGIAFTYNEPLVWYEFVYDTCKVAREAGLKTVLVTNGFISERPFRELVPLVDALNIDIKSVKEGFYNKMCKGTLHPVLKTAEISRQYEKHVELTYLIIPNFNDIRVEYDKLGQWIRQKLGPDTPLHLSAYFPHHKLKVPRTPVETLTQARDVFQKYLNFVYLGNVVGQDAGDTVCPDCQTLNVRRQHYLPKLLALDGGKCANCGRDLGIIQ